MVFRTFTRNLKKAGHAAISSPLPISSREGARVLAHWEVAADAIFIDAAHEYAAALEDMVAYWPLLRPGGVFFGDDATHRKVWRALEAFRARLSAPRAAARLGVKSPHTANLRAGAACFCRELTRARRDDDGPA